MQSPRLLPVYTALLIALLPACQSSHKKSSDQLGEIHFEVTGKDEAQPFFKKGILLLHSFEFADAAESFQEALKLDPSFVMAYWGEAMTHNHPLWQEQDFEKGIGTLNRLATSADERVAKAKTELEKDFIKGINILYGNGNKAERDSSYAVYMETLYKKYPGNDEIASFYSLALNGWGTTDRSPVIFEKAATIGLEVLQRNPRHPGALHYVIHAYDNPDHASLALATADKYAIVAPDASHALHMPTHTYLALGLWDKVVSSNEVSWASSKARKERKKLDNDALGYHSYHWLLYGYLQQEHNKKARVILDSMKEFCRVLPSPRARAHLIYLKSTYAAETNDYSNAVGIDIRQNDLNISVKAKEYFVKGMQAFYNKNEEALEEVILQLAGERLVEEAKAADKGLRICGNVNPSQVTKLDLQESMVMELELKAMKAWLKKDAALTEKLLKEAISVQTLSGYSYGPPSVVKPSFEMYGEWLLENNKPKEAIEQFDLSLKLAPNRLLSKKGKAAALKLAESNPIASR